MAGYTLGEGLGHKHSKFVMKLYAKLMIFCYDKSSNQEELIVQHFQKQLLFVKEQYLEAAVTIASDIIPIDATEDRLTLCAGDESYDFEYSFKGLVQLIKEYRKQKSDINS